MLGRSTTDSVRTIKQWIKEALPSLDEQNIAKKYKDYRALATKGNFLISVGKELSVNDVTVLTSNFPNCFKLMNLPKTEQLQVLDLIKRNRPAFLDNQTPAIDADASDENFDLTAADSQILGEMDIP